MKLTVSVVKRGGKRGRMGPSWFWLCIRMIQYGQCEYLNKEY